MGAKAREGAEGAEGAEAILYRAMAGRERGGRQRWERGSERRSRCSSTGR